MSVRALQLAAGTIEALVEAGAITEACRVTFAGPAEGLGSHTIADILDAADAALAAAEAPAPAASLDPAGLHRARCEALRHGDVAFNRADAIVKAYVGVGR